MAASRFTRRSRSLFAGHLSAAAGFLVLGATSLVHSLARSEVESALDPLQARAAEQRADGSQSYGGRRNASGGGGRPGGPTQGTEKAVLDGLRWLVRHQNPDGSWGASRLKDRCQPESPCYDPKLEYSASYDEGLTGLTLLAFLGAGFTPESRQQIADTAMAKRYVIGDVVRAGLEWLVKRQNADGSFGRLPYLYCESIATTAVCEAFGMTRSGEWLPSARSALRFIQAAQRPSPSGMGLWGWRYDSRTEIEDLRKSGVPNDTYMKLIFDADTSSTGWALMALQAGRRAGLDVKQESIDGAMEFVKWATADNGMVGYIDPKGAGATLTGHNDQFIYHPTTMSALGMCIRIFSQHDPDDPFLELAARRIVADLPTVSKDKLSIDYYYWYFGSLALNQFDGPESPKKTGKYWGPWSKAMVDAVLSLQNHKERACTNGGWIEGDRWSYTGGPLYCTAINVLTLEVFYRYENSFVRPSPAPRPEDELRLIGESADTFQSSRKRIHEALQGKDDELDTALTDAIELHTRVRVAQVKATGIAERGVREDLHLMLPENVLRDVARRIELGSEVYAPALRARILAKVSAQPCSRWLVGQFLSVENRAARASLAEDALALRMAGASSQNAVELAKHGLLDGLRALVCADTTKWASLAAQLAQYECAVVAHVDAVAEHEDVRRARGRVKRTEAPVKLAIESLQRAKSHEDRWKRVRALRAALVELDGFGAELTDCVGMKWRSPTATVEASTTAPKTVSELGSSALQLGQDPYLERSRLAHFLIAHPEFTLVPIADGRIALFDSQSDTDPGLELAVEMLGDPYWRIVAHGN